MEKLRKIILVIAILVFLGSAGYLLRYLWMGHVAESDFDGLKADNGHNLEELYKKNSDIVGWIEIDDTHVDYPVMQTPDSPEFYLRKNFDKEYSLAGTPFVDAESDMYLPSKNWIVYGHNMKNRTMFHDIVQYEEQDFYEEHKTFTFDTLKKIQGDATYEVVAAFRTKIYNQDDEVFKYYQYAFIDDEETFNEYIDGILKLSAIDSGITPKYGEQLVTLSTCEYHDEDGRFVVVARKIEKKK